jgi:hypothetical protein
MLILSQDLADPDLHGLMYDNFSTESMQMRPLLAELEKRAAPSAPAAASMQLSVEESYKVPPMNEDALLADYSMTQESDDGRTGRTKAFAFSSPEFAAMLSECRTAYFDARRALLLGLVGSCLARIEAAVHAEDASAGSSSADSSVVRLARRGLDFLRALCESEYKLYDHFFVVDDDEQRGSTGQSSATELQAYLETICAALHDRVRPRIQKETSPAVLSRICAALLEVPDAEEQDDAPSRSADLLLQPLLRPLLDAAQAQLVLKAREDFGKIAAHTPTADDVDYPAKLGGAAGAAAAAHRRAKSSIGGAGLFQAAEAASAMAASTQRAENEGKIRLFTSPPASVTRSWYTPLTRTLQGLSLVYERVPTSVFYDVGMSAVEACRASLVTGAEALRTGGGGLGTGRIGLSGRLDGPLFWLRHLLLLREIALSVQLSADTGGHGPADRIAALTGHARGAPAASAGMALDFATVASVVNALWAGTSALLAPRSLYQLARGAGAAVAAPESPMPPSSPRETSHAAMQQLEEDIQRASTQLVSIIAESTALPLRVYISQISRTPLPAATEPRSPDAQSPEAGVTSPTSPLAKRRASEVGAVGKARGAYDAFCKCTEVNLKEARSAIRAYLEDERAMGSLVEPVLVSRRCTSLTDIPTDAPRVCRAKSSRAMRRSQQSSASGIRPWQSRSCRALTRSADASLRCSQAEQCTRHHHGTCTAALCLGEAHGSDEIALRVVFEASGMIRRRVCWEEELAPHLAQLHEVRDDNVLPRRISAAQHLVVGAFVRVDPAAAVLVADEANRVDQAGRRADDECVRVVHDAQRVVRRLRQRLGLSLPGASDGHRAAPCGRVRPVGLQRRDIETPIGTCAAAEATGADEAPLARVHAASRCVWNATNDVHQLWRRAQIGLDARCSWLVGCGGLHTCLPRCKRRERRAARARTREGERSRRGEAGRRGQRKARRVARRGPRRRCWAAARSSGAPLVRDGCRLRPGWRGERCRTRERMHRSGAATS